METSPNEEALALVDSFWDTLLELQPLLGTMVGDDRFDDRLPDPGQVGREAETALARDATARAAALDRSELDAGIGTTIDLMEAVAARIVAAAEHRVDRLDAANHMTGPGDMITALPSLTRGDTPERLDRYEARLRSVPAFFEAWEDVLAEAIGSGVTSPKVVAERSIGMLEGLSSGDPSDSGLLQPVPPSERDRFTDLVREVVDPAIARYRAALQAAMPHMTDAIAVSSLPDGPAIYDTQILGWTSLPAKAAEVHELGRERFDAIQRERSEIAAGLGFATPREATDTHSAEDVAASSEDLVALARGQVERSWEDAPRFFGVMPRANCEVRPVEPFRERDVPAAFYYPPTEDGSRPGIYYVNTYDLPSRPLHRLAAITFHEANPGHHFQIAVEQELTDRPRLRRFGGILAGSAFAEGWGLYAERLADELGLYADEWERLGMLDAQALRAARLITDTGMHAFGWTRDEAIATLEDAGVPPIDAAVEIDRYIAMPGQALSYMLGMIEIERARAAAVPNGDPEELRAFHDRLLLLGQLPLPVLRRELGVTAAGH